MVEIVVFMLGSPHLLSVFVYIGILQFSLRIQIVYVSEKKVSIFLQNLFFKISEEKQIQKFVKKKKCECAMIYILFS